MAANKRAYWKARVLGSVTANLVVDDNGVYVATRDNALYLLDPSLGGRRWRLLFSGPLYEPPVITPEAVFQYCPDDGVVAINPGTVGVEQRVRWILPRGRQLLTVDERAAYLLSRDESIVVAKLVDGTILHEIPTPGFTMPMSSPDDLALYVASRDGRVFCARKRGVPPVRAAEVQAALRGPGEPADQEAQAAEEGGVRPVAQEDQRKSQRPGPPIGGKSKVSKEYSGD